MSQNMRWSVLHLPHPGAALAARLKRWREHESRSQKTALTEWENEGGNVEPSGPTARNATPTTDSA